MNPFLTSGFSHSMSALALALGLCAATPVIALESTADFLGSRMPYAEFDRLPATRLEVSGADLTVAFAPGPLDLPQPQVLDWIRSAAQAVTAYYGRFPAASARILVVPRAGRGVGAGKAWAYRGAALRVAIGEQSTAADLARDWVLVHEMVHLAFPGVPERHHWIEEGLASYVESIARAQAGQLSAETVWAELVAGLPKGLPQSGDRGLDNTPTWGRTYWGGALYCLLADVEIRRRSANRFGLQHALRAILAVGNMESSSALEPLLEIGDRAVGVPVLAELYAAMKDSPAPVDLDALWRRLGVRSEGRGVGLDETAPEAAIRRAISAPDDAIAWQPWSDAVFDQARREGRFVLLDLEAVWCHWCHVMDRTTYRDPRVVKLVQQRYIAVKVDQDSHPELSRRYEEYGWPATVVFAAGGGEIAKRRGYLNPETMLSYLEHIVRDPSPVRYRDSEPVRDFAASPLLVPGLRAELEKRFLESHDTRRGGLAAVHKFLDRDSVEYALFRAREGDAVSARMARQTLDGAFALIDPAWGGMYQYSTHGDWRHPHYEKIMQVQADALRLYAHAWAQFRHPPYLKAAARIHRYVRDFLASPEGAYYASQDADLVKGVQAADYFALGDAARRKRGIPAIDKNRYARENGWLIHALATLYAAGGDEAVLEEAALAARWVLAHRALPGGGFRHGERDTGGPFLEDTLAMGRAFLALYQATGERDWLARAESAAAFIEARFRGEPGYLSAPARAGAVLKPRPQVDENAGVARFANLLAHHTGNQRYRAQAEHAMRLLATEAVALYRRTEPGILLAARELASDPVHLTVLGAKRDPAARSLYRAALAQPGVYRRIEWWDAAEGPLPNPDVGYPQLERAAAFVCAERACSIPLYDPANIGRFFGRKR